MVRLYGGSVLLRVIVYGVYLFAQRIVLLTSNDFLPSKRRDSFRVIIQDNNFSA